MSHTKTNDEKKKKMKMKVNRELDYASNCEFLW